MSPRFVMKTVILFTRSIKTQHLKSETHNLEFRSTLWNSSGLFLVFVDPFPTLLAFEGDSSSLSQFFCFCQKVVYTLGDKDWE